MGFRNKFSKEKEATKKSKTLADYYYAPGTAKNVTDYEETTKFLLNHIRKTYDHGDDIATALEEGDEYDLESERPQLTPTRSTGDSAADKITEKQNEMMYQAEIELFLARKTTYAKNKIKVHAFLWEKCSKLMKGKIESRKDYDEVKKNPIKLLKAIKEHCMSFQDQRYEYATILDAIKTFHNLHQKQGESLQDYTTRFKHARDMVESHIGGPLELTKAYKSLPDYDESKPDTHEKCKEQAWKRYQAILYLSNADSKKYGSISSGLETQMSLGNNQYPTTVTQANNVLSNHKFDNTTNNNNDKNSNQKHFSRNDEKDDEEGPALTFAQAEGRCYCCGNKNHYSHKCRHKDKIPKDQWYIEKVKRGEAEAQTHNQSSSTTSNTNQSSSQSNSNQSLATSWNGAHIQFYQANEMRNVMLLDNQSTVDIFCNDNYVVNIREVPEKLNLTTNAGVLTTNLKADVPGYGTVWFSPYAITNIFSFARAWQTNTKLLMMRIFTLSSYMLVTSQCNLHAIKLACTYTSRPTSESREPNSISFWKRSRKIKSFSRIGKLNEQRKLATFIMLLEPLLRMILRLWFEAIAFETTR